MGEAQDQGLGVSVDSVEDHRKWKQDIQALGGAPADFRIIDDTGLGVSKAFDMLPADYYPPSDGRTPAHSATVRTVYIIGPDKKVRADDFLSDVGRAQFPRKSCVRWMRCRRPTACPSPPPRTGSPGRTILALSVPTEEGRAKYGEVDVRLPYVRFVKLPSWTAAGWPRYSGGGPRPGRYRGDGAVAACVFAVVGRAQALLLAARPFHDPHRRPDMAHDRTRHPRHPVEPDIIRAGQSRVNRSSRSASGCRLPGVQSMPPTPVPKISGPSSGPAMFLSQLL